MCVLTIVTINFNSGEGLRSTYNSVIHKISENREKYQWILIDGLSTDQSANYCHSPYKENFDIVVSESDSGIYNAMNKGLNLASGHYIVFMNSGDEFYPKFHLLSWVEYLNSSNDCIYYTNVLIKYKNRKNFLKDYSGRSLNFNLGLPFCHQAVYVPRSIYIHHRFDESYRIYATLPYFLDIINVHCVKHIKITSCIYDMSGVSSSITLNNVKELIRFNKEKGDYDINVLKNILMLWIKSKVKRFLRFE